MTGEMITSASKPLDGGAFILEDLINKPSQVMQVAVCRPMEGKRAGFDAGRDAFIGRVAVQPG